MRTTVRVDDALLRELKSKASEEGVSLTRLFDRILRAGLRVEQRDKKPRRVHREQTHSMGEPRVDLTKALVVAFQLEDAETLRKSRLRK